MASISFSGLASGIDSEAIIKSIIEARRQVTAPLKTRQKALAAEDSAIDDLGTRLNGLDSVLKNFRTLAGGVFNTSVSSTIPDSIVATAKPGAPVTTARIAVQQIARPGSVTLGGRIDSTSSPIVPTLAMPGQLTVSVGSGDAQKDIPLDITSSTTLSDLQSQLNELGKDRLFASVINTGSQSQPAYALVISSTETGMDKGRLNVSASGDLAGSTFMSQLSTEQATNAILNVQGIGQLERQSNTVTDVIPGVTLNLKSPTTEQAVLTVERDTSKLSGQVTEMVEKLNDLVRFSKQSSITTPLKGSEAGELEYGDLARTRVDESLVTDLRTALSRAKASSQTASTINVAADLGIKITRDGTYEFDPAMLTSAISKQPERVQEILQAFADDVSTAGGIVSNYSGANGKFKAATDANEKTTKSIEDKLAQVERALTQQTDTLKKTFMNLETTVGRLNSGASALSSILGGLSTGKR